MHFHEYKPQFASFFNELKKQVCIIAHERDWMTLINASEVSPCWNKVIVEDEETPLHNVAINGLGQVT